VDETPRVVRIEALLAHSNIDRAIGRIQEEIFSSFGLTSALALPPMIPLRFLAGNPLPGDSSRDAEPAPTARALDGLTVRTTSFRVVENALYLGAESRLPSGRRTGSTVGLGVDDVLERLPLGAHVDTDDPLFPPAPGFFLCVDQETCGESALLRRVAEAVAPAPALHFHPLGIGIFTVEAQSSKRWWRALSWEMQSLIRLRKGKAS